MAVSTETLVSELNKIDKKELIIIIVYNKLPSNLTLNSVASEFFKKLVH